MSRRIPKFAGWAVGAFVAMALALGATVAFAKPANATSCANDGWNFLGAYFGPSRTPVSADVGQLFRSIPDTRFA